MTPKEKAKEFYDKFYMVIPSDEMGLCDEASRQCALIAADELMQKTLWDKSEHRFWKEVKQEIENL